MAHLVRCDSLILNLDHALAILPSAGLNGGAAILFAQGLPSLILEPVWAWCSHQDPRLLYLHHQAAEDLRAHLAFYGQKGAPVVAPDHDGEALPISDADHADRVERLVQSGALTRAEAAPFLRDDAGELI